VGELHTHAYRKAEAIDAEVGMMMRLKESREPSAARQGSARRRARHSPCLARSITSRIDAMTRSG
jgi:ferric-dicitrate binding protein FerR (iron transport regulator)